MRANLEERLTRPVTVLHRRGLDEDVWQVERIERAMWVAEVGKNYATDGMVEDAPSVTIQIPEDQGAVEVEPGDWATLAEVEGETLTTAEVKKLEGIEHVTRVRDARGGLAGIQGAALRYASSLIVECG